MGNTVFYPTKGKTNRVRFLSDFRDLNRQLKRKPHPMQKIREIILKLELFQYDTSLELKMCYYHVCLIKQSSKMYTIILPWVKYEYKRLPMGVSTFLVIFQDKTNEMFRGFEFIQVYIDNLSITTNGYWSNHLEKLELILQNLK